MTSAQPHKKKFSFEFFPPRSPAAEAKLKVTQQELAKLKPDFFSVTCGAGGSTREKTFETVCTVRDGTGIETASHMSCIGLPIEEIKNVINTYRQNEFSHLVVLRGDNPSGLSANGPLKYANELIELIRKEQGDYFYIDVACYPEFHPQSKSAQQDLQNFKRKVQAGADSAITQYFYNPYAYFRFLESCQKLNINIPIVPGIMPITNRDQLVRFSNVCGAEIPIWILKRLQDFDDDLDGIRQFGIDVTTELCSVLLDGGAPGLHIYSINNYESAMAIWRNLGNKIS